MIAKVYSAIPQGYDGHIVEVEGDTNKGLPCFNIVGMANKTITEARERVRSAIANSGLIFPQKKVTINLAPAELAKDGSHLDLPIALAILVLSQQLLASDLAGRLFVGELSLNGATKPVRGIINIVEAAKNAGYQEVFVPEANLATARLIPDIKITAVKNLSDLVLYLKGLKIVQPQKCIQTASAPEGANVVKNNRTDLTEAGQRASHVVKNTRTESKTLFTLDDIRGQFLAKRALIIALAGHHNLLLSGPPGAGKTLLARVASNLLPAPSLAEQIEIAKLHSLFDPEKLTLHRPFRAPHHTASTIALIGGGTKATPGEISLAHRGVLFLDELPEYPRSVIESLRQPLEDGEISIARANQHVTYPARFILIATMNPCPCGYLGDPNHDCSCSRSQINAYHKRLSGPILDRIDITIKVRPVPCQDLVKNSVQNVVKNTQTDRKSPSEHQTALNLIHTAANMQAERYRNHNTFNSSLSPKDIATRLQLSSDVEQFLQSAATKLRLSARSYFKTIKVARTIADLTGSADIDIEHISEALSFRNTPSQS